MIKKASILILFILLTGCVETPRERRIAFNEKYALDVCLQREIIKEILQNLPKGSDKLTAAGNDWDEIIVEAKKAAREMSVKEKESVKPECRAEAW